MVYKNKLTPLSKGGQVDKVAGKGSQTAAMPDRREIKQLATGGIGDYAKASPTMPSPGVKAPFGTFGLE